MANSVVSFRINITASWGSTYVGAGEILVKDSSGAYISLASATITASSTYADWGPERLKDGSTNQSDGSWASDGSGFPQWINVAFPSAVDVAVVEIQNTSYGADESIKSGNIVATHTGGDTTTVSFSTRTKAANGISSHTIPPLSASFTALTALPPLETLPPPASLASQYGAVIARPPKLDDLPAPSSLVTVTANGQTILTALPRLDDLPKPSVLGVWQLAYNTKLPRLDDLPAPSSLVTVTANGQTILTALPRLDDLPAPSSLVTVIGQTIRTTLPRLSDLPAPYAGVQWWATYIKLQKLSDLPKPSSVAKWWATYIKLHKLDNLPLPAARVRQNANARATAASSYWMRVDSVPSIGFYAGKKPEEMHEDIGLTMQRLSSLLPIRRPLSVPQLYPAEISNASADIDNADGVISSLWSLPPVRTAASMWLGDQKLMDGVITSIKSGSTVSLDLESGLRAPITDTMPLRTSVVWGSFKDVRAIPWVYGRATITPVAYDSSMRIFVLADHAVQGVDDVKIDGIAVSAFALHHAEDSTGKTVAFLEIDEPLESGAELAVTLRGKMHALNGALLTRPAEVIYDLVVNMLGMNIPVDSLDKLRSAGVDVELGGVFDDAGMQIKEAIDSVVQSFGGAWSFGADDVVIFDPWIDDTDKPTALTPTLRNSSAMALDANHDNLATVVRVIYDHDYAKDAPRRAVQVEAPEAIIEYGRIEREHSAPWLKTPRQGEILATRLLSHLARPQWQATWQDATQPPPAPGMFADLSKHPYAALQGRHRLLTADIDPATRMTQCRIVAPAGAAPRIVLKALSTAFDPDIRQVSTSYANGVATFIIRDQNGNPLQGASVTLNNTATRITDSAGAVSFTTPRGKARLLIKAHGMADNNVEVTV